jgi:hypothetical protein
MGNDMQEDNKLKLIKTIEKILQTSLAAAV